MRWDQRMITEKLLSALSAFIICCLQLEFNMGGS